MSMDNFAYTTLPDNRTAIRLLEVLPELQDDRIQCRLKNADLQDTYNALSYTWGTTRIGYDIVLNDKRFPVGQNLRDFLILARQHFGGVLFWIDAICINQNDIDERNTQVAMMRHIYAEAEQTVIWIGATESGSTFWPEVTPKSPMPLRNFSEEFRGCAPVLKNLILSGKPEPEVPSYRKLRSVCTMIEEICQHPYWSRLWIIQEVLASKEKVILCPGFILSWYSFERVMSWMLDPSAMQLPRPLEKLVLLKPFRSILELGTQHSRKILSPNALHDLHSKRTMAQLVSRVVVENVMPKWTSRIERERLQYRFCPTSVYVLTAASEAVEQVSNPIDFVKAAWRFRKSICTDQRDKIYGLLALHGDQALSVDYSETVYDLYFRVCSRLDIGEPMDGSKLAGWPWYNLLSILNLAPIDMVFGDPQYRSFLVLLSTNSSDDSWDSCNFRIETVVLHKDEDESDGLCCYAVVGVCHRCGKPIRLITARSIKPNNESCAVVISYLESNNRSSSA